MILRSDRFETTPGSTGECAVLASPADFSGDGRAFTEWLRNSYDNDPLIRQVLAIQALNGDSPRHGPSTFMGPFACELQDSITRLRGWLRSKPKATCASSHHHDDGDVGESLSDLQRSDDCWVISTRFCSTGARDPTSMSHAFKGGSFFYP